MHPGHVFEQIVKDGNGVITVEMDLSTEDAMMGQLDNENWELSKLCQEKDRQLCKLANELQ